MDRNSTQSMNDNISIRDQFRLNGYIVVRSLFTDNEIDFYKHQIDVLSAGRGHKWTFPDGICRNRAFWNVIFHEKILQTVRELLGEDIRFLQHNDLHAGFSSFHWHRDSVSRTYPIGPDWDEIADPYQLLRVGIYLQDSSGGFRLGLVRGTHRPGRLSERERAFIEQKLSSRTKAFILLGGKDPLEERADWVATGPGDCIIFDPRIIHTGSEFKGTKYSLFLGYGVENGHFRRHYNYYRYLREDLNYQALHPDLVQRLQSAGLYAGETADIDSIPGAWMPGKVFNLLAKRFK